MAEYQHFFGRPDGVVSLTLFDAALNDDEAVMHALGHLTDHDSCDRVDVVQGDRLVARIERPRPACGLSASRRPRRRPA